MSDKLTLRKIGNSVGVIIPKSDLDRHNLAEGDDVFIVHGPDGIRLMPHDPEFEDAIRHAREFMHEYRDTFRELAK